MAFRVHRPTVRVAARYASCHPLRSGGAAAADRTAGAYALAEADLGAGSMVRVGLRPEHRGPSVATSPLVQVRTP